MGFTNEYIYIYIYMCVCGCVLFFVLKNVLIWYKYEKYFFMGFTDEYIYKRYSHFEKIQSNVERLYSYIYLF